MPYDPWRDLRENWPEITVLVEPMDDDLLGELRYPLIALRAGTSAAQQRCTLAHELVHLERGVDDCGPWQEREERAVHSEVARRLITTDGLIAAIRQQGGAPDQRELARALAVDLDTLTVRLELLTKDERRRIETLLRQLPLVA